MFVFISFIISIIMNIVMLSCKFYGLWVLVKSLIAIAIHFGFP